MRRYAEGELIAVPNIRTDELRDEDGYRRSRLAELAGAEHLGLTVYELPPGGGRTTTTTCSGKS